MKWIEALKHWNRTENKCGGWVVPKRGSEMYNQVRALMGGKEEVNEKLKEAQRKPVNAKLAGRMLKSNKKKIDLTEFNKHLEELTSHRKVSEAEMAEAKEPKTKSRISAQKALVLRKQAMSLLKPTKDKFGRDIASKREIIQRSPRKIKKFAELGKMYGTQGSGEMGFAKNRELYGAKDKEVAKILKSSSRI